MARRRPGTSVGVPTNQAWTKTGIVAAGIEYTIIRVERKAKAA
jgi:hypothetical protein